MNKYEAYANNYEVCMNKYDINYILIKFVFLDSLKEM